MNGGLRRSDAFAAGKFHFEPPVTSFDHLVGAREHRGREVEAEWVQERVGGFLAVGSPLVVGQRVPLAALALKHRLPGMFPFKENVVAGGLMSYGADSNYLFCRAAGYHGQNLKGPEPPGPPRREPAQEQGGINR